MGNIKDKTLPFIPSYLRNSPLDIFNRTAKTPILLPTKCKNDRIRYVQILDNELGIIYTGFAAAVRADHPISSIVGIYYFEIDILDGGELNLTGIGVASGSFILYRQQPGLHHRSIGYHGRNGFIYFGGDRGNQYGPLYSTGDTIGCCLNYYDQTIFYTKNGINLGVASTRVFRERLYPVIGIGTRGARIEANFGAKPFKFDIDFYARSILAKVMKQKIIITNDYSSETEDSDEDVCCLRVLD
ncbi:19839_t:CDS:2 [Cetraspora pellucida]|uniref:19839_t:CDS:1 n=1 Tax=Cetraspora pellucida TaxID=1433469 RepID=A0A9N9FQ23_9GLOM|nr:19839_t:CDS:2 [Cetraspora pellucida]